MISDEKSLNTTDTLDKFDEESKNTIRSTILQQLTPSMDHHQVTKIGKEVVDIRGEERDDDEDDDEHNYLYDSLG
ncbi:unnamed protein product [Heterobilharzia americana]|nr:unnamed protein product [Heterobilharzia americana]